MKQRAVAFAPEALDDLLNIYNWIAEAAGPGIAIGYIGRLEAYCLGFDLVSERGTVRDDIRPGLRTIGFEHRVTLAFSVDSEQITFLRIFYGGRDWRAELA